jgi:hypothetical protein
LRAKLVNDNGRTIVKGCLGMHILVAVFAGVVLWAALDDHPARSLKFVLFILILLGGGYLYERRQFLRALATCLGVELRDFKKRAR